MELHALKHHPAPKNVKNCGLFLHKTTVFIYYAICFKEAFSHFNFNFNVFGL